MTLTEVGESKVPPGRPTTRFRASALSPCQEVYVWANKLGEEALSQDSWPREGPVVLA